MIFIPIYLGFYSVLLHGTDVFVELTVAGPFTGLHRYKFLGEGRRYLIFDPTHAVKRVSFTLHTDRQSKTLKFPLRSRLRKS